MSLHLGDLLLSRSYVLLKLFNFMIKDIFKFLKFLTFLLQLVDLPLVSVDSLIPFLNDLSLLLDFPLKLLIGDF